MFINVFSEFKYNFGWVLVGVIIGIVMINWINLVLGNIIGLINNIKKSIISRKNKNLDE